jgi:hypothetical protein
MTPHARIARLAAVWTALLVLATGCGESDSPSPTTTDSASAEPSESSEPSEPVTSAAPSAEPSKVPFDRSVLTAKAPASMAQPVKLVNGEAKNTVIAVRPMTVEPASPAGLAGLSGKDLAAVKGKKAYFLTYRVSYVNGKVLSLAPFVTLGLLGADDTPFTSVIGAESRGCRSADTAGKTFGAGSSYTECAIEVSPSGAKPSAIQYTDYTMPDVRPVWPVR